MDRREALTHLGVITAGLAVAPSLLRAAPAATEFSVFRWTFWDTHPPFRITREPAGDRHYLDRVRISGNAALWPYFGQIWYTVTRAPETSWHYGPPQNILGRFTLLPDPSDSLYNCNIIVEPGQDLLLDIQLKTEMVLSGPLIPLGFQVAVQGNGAWQAWPYEIGRA